MVAHSWCCSDRRGVERLMRQVLKSPWYEEAEQQVSRVSSGEGHGRGSLPEAQLEGRRNRLERRDCWNDWNTAG